MRTIAIPRRASISQKRSGDLVIFVTGECSRWRHFQPGRPGGWGFLIKKFLGGQGEFPTRQGFRVRLVPAPGLLAPRLVVWVLVLVVPLALVLLELLALVLVVLPRYAFLQF